MRVAALLGLFVVAGAHVACSNNSSEPRGQQHNAPNLAARAVELTDVMRTAPIAFRPASDGLVAHAQHHAITASPDHISIVPRAAGKRTRGFRTATVIQGVAGVTTPFRASSATSVSRTLQGVDERIENGVDHVQQSWVFASRPASSITVHVQVEGYTYADSAERGLRFVDSESGISVRYGHATWIDARGAQTPIRAKWTGRSIDLVLDESLLSASAFPATLDPLITVEIEPDAPVLVPDIRGQGSASVATSGTTSLAILFQGSHDVQDHAKGIYTVRVGSDGLPLDACGVPLSTASTNAATTSYGAPVITYAGGVFLAAWVQNQGCAFEIRARRLNASGALLDSADTVVASGSSCSPSGQLRVAFDGSRFLLVWVNYETGMLEAATMKPDGAVGSEISIASVAGVVGAVAGLSGGGWIVGWVQPGPGNVFLTRIAADGTVVAPGTMVPGSGLASSPSLASSGSELLLAWNGLGDIQAQRLDATGSPVGGTINVTSSPLEQTRPTIAWDGAAWFLVWEQPRSGGLLADVYARRVSATGMLLGSSELISEATRSGYFPWVGPAIDGVFTAAMQTVQPDPASWSYTISTMRRFDSGGVALDAAPVPLLRCATPENKPAVAWSGSQYLVVWEDRRNGPDPDLYGVRIAPDGTVLDPIAIPISTAPLAQQSPAVVSDGTRFLVVWDDSRSGSRRDIYGTFVDATGVVASPGGLLIHTLTSGVWSPVVAAGGNQFLVAWEQGTSEVAARFLDSNAATLGQPFQVTPFTGATQRPSVAYGDGHFIVSFGGNARRYDPSGISLDPVALSLNSSFGGAGRFAASDDGWLFTYLGIGGIYARRVGFDGSLPLPVASWPQPTLVGGNPSSGWDGEQFLNVWHAPASSAYAAPHLLLAARVTNEAEAIDTAPIALTDGTTSAILGNVAGGAPGSFLVVFQAWEPSVPYVNDRVRALLVTVEGAATGTACESGTECRNGLCVDGVCCRVRCGDGIASDCASCSVTNGGTADGRCTPIAMGTLCRAAAGECDVSDVCDGTNRPCPPDEHVADGEECSVGMCSGGTCTPPVPDAGVPDAPLIDAPPLDAPPLDASPPDASPADAQVIDAPPGLDAGDPPDAPGLVDAFVGEDMPTPDAARSNGDRGSGCGCQTPREAPNGVLWLTTFVVFVLRRRTRRSSTDRTFDRGSARES